MAQSLFPITTFALANGTPLADGYLLLYLNKDCQASSGQVCSGVITRVDLNSSGQLTVGAVFWPNNELVPSDSQYILSAYTVKGQRVLGPVAIIVGPSGGLGFGQSFGSSFGS